VETICSQTNHCGLTTFFCFVYDFQTLLVGAAAIVVAIIAGIPVWRQLRDTNLQTRISHRETLATLLRDALRRYEKVDQSIRRPLSIASDVTSLPYGEPTEIGPHDAHHLENQFSGLLDWYLVVLSNTEHSDIEAEKTSLKAALDGLVETLGEAHWADHNDQQDEDRNTPDDEWAEILARCAQAKIDASQRVCDVQAAYGALVEAQRQWVRSLRTQIAQLDSQIAAADVS
jgi:hypothetical protein